MQARKNPLSKYDSDDSLEETLSRASDELYKQHIELLAQLADQEVTASPSTPRQEKRPEFLPPRSQSVPIVTKPKECQHYDIATGISYFAPKRKIPRHVKANSIVASNPTSSFSSTSEVENIIGTPHPRSNSLK